MCLIFLGKLTNLQLLISSLWSQKIFIGCWLTNIFGSNFSQFLDTFKDSPEILPIIAEKSWRSISNFCFCVFTSWKPHNSFCILNVLHQYSTCESTKDRKELRNNQENYVVVHISLVTPFPDGSAIHLFWLIIVVASFELKEVTGCPMANWQIS